MSATAAVPGVRIADVRVGERARKDYGDLDSLKASIVEHGLLQPIVLLPDDYLLCGGRRLEACKQLGWASIPFVRSTTQGDAISRLKAERDENTCRKDMTPSELVALGKQLEELERPKALERQGARTDLTSSPRGEEVASRSTDAVVGEALGMSSTTYWRAKNVVDTAEDVTAPESVRIAAAEARDAMDAGKLTINGAANKVAEAKRAARTDREKLPLDQRLAQICALADKGMSSGQIGKEIGLAEDRVRELARKNNVKIVADEVSRGRRRVDPNRVISTAVLQASGLSLGSLLDELDFAALDRDNLEEWISSLSESINALKALKKSLEKELNRD